jgi:hypothetical protein
MIESNFVSIFAEIAKKTLNGVIVKQKASLFYEIYLDTNLRVSNTDFINPKRGNSAFETDICIFEKLIETELEISKTLERIQFENEKYDYFQSNIIFRKFDESK